ncbi:MAG: hypothetical protein AB7O96_06820 [Pseudobdellovibrionaceae bacterium]
MHLKRPRVRKKDEESNIKFWLFGLLFFVCLIAGIASSTGLASFVGRIIFSKPPNQEEMLENRRKLYSDAAQKFLQDMKYRSNQVRSYNDRCTSAKKIDRKMQSIIYRAHFIQQALHCVEFNPLCHNAKALTFIRSETNSIQSHFEGWSKNQTITALNPKRKKNRKCNRNAMKAFYEIEFALLKFQKTYKALLEMPFPKRYQTQVAASTDLETNLETKILELNDLQFKQDSH